MKKLLSLFLALTLVFSFCCIFASADGEEPEAYLWLTATEEVAPGIQFKIPGESFSNDDYRIITNVCFEGCEGEGTAYVNYYVYSKDATGVGDYDHLIQFADFASHKTAGEGWNEIEFTFNPCTGLYGSFTGTTVDPSEIGFVTVGIGFWQATGTVKCSSVRINKGVEVVWSKGFGAGLDPETDEQIAYAALGEKGVNWDIVRPEVADNGNIAKEATLEVEVGSSTYNACLNDGAAYSQKSYTNDWFAFTRNVSPLGDFRGTECYNGAAIFDFGEPVYWNAVRANIWDAAGDSGIASPIAIVVYASDDKETWTEIGDVTMGEAGTVYWAEGEFDATCSRYVKVAFPWANGAGAFVFVNEIEIIGCEAPVVGDFDGDANGDGKVSSADAIYLLRAIFNPTSYPITFDGDVNGDGVTNTADAIYLLRFVFFPELYPLVTKPVDPEPTVCPITVTGDEGIAAVSDEKLAKLIDGVYADGATAFGDDRLVGIEWQSFDYTAGAENGTKQVVLVYDLGELTDLTGVKLGAYKERNSFVDLPAVKVYLSNDGETYVRAADGAWTSPVEGLIASTDRNGEAPKGEATYTADWSTRATLKAQYIKLVLTYTDPWAFLSEIGFTTEIAASKAENALEENKGAAIDVIALNGVDVAIANAAATILTSAAGEIPLDNGTTGDYAYARSGVITVAKWDASKGGYVVTSNAVNPWPNDRAGTMTIADDEIGVFTVSSGNIDNEGAARKWVIWHIEAGDVLYVYDDVIAINHKIDDKDSRCFVTEKTIDDIDTTDWTYVDGETQGLWQNDSDPVGTYYYNAGIVDDKYVIEILFNGELSGTADSFGNGNGTNFRVWFHTAKNADDAAQSTYNSFIDVAYTPDAVLNRFMINGTTSGNSAAAKYGYDDEKPYIVESLISEELDAMYVKIVLDEVPNCTINEDLDAIITVSNKPEGASNNALYSGSFKTPYSGWDREQAFNFYEIPVEPVREAAEPTGKNFALKGDIEIVGAAVTGDPLTAGYDKYKSALNDGVASVEKVYTNDWFGFYYSPTADPSVCNSINGTSGEYAGNIGSAVIDLGKELTWNQVRVNTWAANASGIGAAIGINVYSSNDGEAWNYEGDMVLGEAGTVYWASTDTEFEAVTARYVKVDVIWTNGVFAFINEIEVYGEPEPIQPEDKAELPAGAIAIDYAGFVYDAYTEILYSAEDTTIGELTGKDLNYFAVAVVDAETMKVTWFGNLLGRGDAPNGVKTDVAVPADSYVIIVNANKSADFASFVPEVGATVTVYNVNLGAIADLEEAAALTSAGFTYKNPSLDDIDTTGWTYVNGESVGMWQNTSAPVGTYNYKTDIVDGKYVVEILFRGELTGTADSFGNGNGTNVRLWWHTAKNAAGTDQITYNTLMDFSYTPDGIIESVKTNTLADGNKGVAYEGDKTYTIETFIPSAKDGLYIKFVFDSIPNCDINEDLDLMITVSSKPETGNNALYSGKYIKPFAKWYRTYAINFYPVPETLQPEVAAELPAGAIAIDYAGFVYDAYNEILYSAQDTTIGELTGKDLNYFAVAVVDAKTMKVTWFGNLLGRGDAPNGVKTDVAVPANSYVIIVNANKSADFAAFVPEVGATVTVYNVNLNYLKTLEGTAALTGAAFTYKNPPKAAEPEGKNYALNGTVVFADAEVTGDPLTAGYDKYKTSLNDGIASEEKVYTNDWCGIYYSSGAVEKGVNNASSDGTDNIGTLIIDLGEIKNWKQVRVHTWAANASGIRAASAIKVYSSIDGEMWKYEADMVLGEAGTIYWASTDTEFRPVTSQYVKVEVIWNGGVFAFINEVEVYSDGE